MPPRVQAPGEWEATAEERARAEQAERNRRAAWEYDRSGADQGLIGDENTDDANRRLGYGYFIDEDGDGVHDRTGETRDEWQRTRTRASRDRANTTARERQALEEQKASRRPGDEARRAADDAAYQAAMRQYETSGQAQRDRDAGTPGANAPQRTRTADPNVPRAEGVGVGLPEGGLRGGPGSSRGGSSSYRSGGGGGGGYGGGGGGGYDSLYGSYRGPEGTAMSRASEEERVTGQIPIVGDGIRAAWAAEDAANEAARMRAAWETLQDWAPSADQLAVDYETGAQDFDPESLAAARDALRSMQDVYQSGGMTAADRSRQMQARYSTGQQMRATREADQAALQARGIGGGGASIASMLNAQQAGATGLAMQDASMLQDAQRRSLQAMQSSGQQSFANANAVNAFNQWRHGLTTRTRDSRSAARQQQFENQSSIRAGLTNQWRGASSDASEAERRKQEASNAQAGAAGALINTVEQAAS
jgi:hypothetical protein